MRFSPIFLSLLVHFPASLPAGNEGLELHEYEGGLEVEIPYDTILPTEILFVSLRIENRGEDSIKVITGGLNDSLQLVWIPCEGGKPVERPGNLLTFSYKKTPTESFSESNLTIYETETLGSGETYEADRVQVHHSLTWNLPTAQNEAEFQPAFYGGEGKVIYGDPFKIKLLSRPPSSFKKVFSTTFTAGGDAHIPFEVYEVPIEGERYLFNNTGVRFCRVPPNVAYSISFRQEGSPPEYFTTVDFDEPALESHIFSWRTYELVSASPATVPWLFEKARQDGSGKSTSTTADERSSGNQKHSAALEGSRNSSSSAVDEHADKSDSPSQPSSWIWIVGGCALLGALALAMLRSAKARG